MKIFNKRQSLATEEPIALDEPSPRDESAPADESLWPATLRTALDDYPRLEVGRDFNACVMQRLAARSQPTLLDRIDALFARPLPKLLGALGLGTVITLPMLAFVGVSALSGRGTTLPPSSASQLTASVAATHPGTRPRWGMSRHQMLARLLQESSGISPQPSALLPASTRSHLPIPSTQTSRPSVSRSSSCPVHGASLV